MTQKKSEKSNILAGMMATIAVFLLGCHVLFVLSPIFVFNNEAWMYMGLVTTSLVPSLFIYELLCWPTKQRKCRKIDTDCPWNARRTLRVCVIGAGASGLCTVKELLQEDHDVDCYDEREDLGGLFLFDRGTKTSVWSGCKLVSSPVNTAFGDFPPEQTTRHWTAGEYVQYLRRYAENFNLLQHIHFSSEITQLERVENSRWKVYIKTKDGMQREESYDAVVIATGLNAIPKYPSNMKQYGEFTGELLHSASQFKDSKDFAGKKVCIVGGGESAVDIAYLVSEHASKVCVSVKSGSFIIPRVDPEIPDIPNDFQSCRLRYIQPMWITNAILYGRRWVCNILGLFLSKEAKLRFQFLRRSDAPAFSKPPTKSNLLIEAVMNRGVQLKPKISGAFGKTVNFVDAPSETFDTIIFSTGLVHNLHSLLPDIDPPSCFMRVFPVQYDNIAIVGYVRPHVGSIPTISEMQARLVAQIFSGKLKLPDNTTMETEIKADLKKSQSDFPFHYDILAHWMRYCDKVAVEIGCKPSVLKLWNKPKLIWHLTAGSYMAAQTRLVGPHSCTEEAEEQIMKVPVTMNYPEMLLGSVLCYTWWFACKILLRNPQLETGLI